MQSSDSKKETIIYPTYKVKTSQGLISHLFI